MIPLLAWAFLPAEIQDNLVTFLLLGSLSAMLISMAKGGFGGSISLLSVPLMIYALGNDTQLYIGVALPLLIVCDYVAVVSWWGKWRIRPVALLLPGAVFGVTIGGFALWALLQYGEAVERGKEQTNAILMMGIGMIALGFVVLQGIRSLGHKPVAFRPGVVQGTLIGSTAGFTSTLAHAAGPITSMYMLPQKFDKGTFVASTVLYYWIGNQLKLVPYFLLGLINPQTLGVSLVLLPAVVIGTLVGIFLHRKVGQKQFTGIVYTLLALAAAYMIYKSAVRLWF